MSLARAVRSVGTPQQARSRAALQRILDAAEQLIEARPLDEVTVADIAGRAGMSIGNFYKRFASKEALLDALYARYEEQRSERLARAFAPARWDREGLDERARWLAATLVTMFRARRGVIRAYVMHHRARSPIDEAEHGRLEGIYRAGATLLLGAREEIRHRRPEEAARFAMLVLASLCRELILFKPPSDPGAVALSDDRLVDELTRTLLGYLRGSR